MSGKRLLGVDYAGVGVSIAFVVWTMAPSHPAALAQDPGASARSDQVTFTRDVAPILQRSCQNCHRPGAIAPMSLLTYEDARPYARAMKTRTGLRTQRGAMPPWYIEKDIGIQQYKDDPSLVLA